jgi:hypothetical protein
MCKFLRSANRAYLNFSIYITRILRLQETGVLRKINRDLFEKTRTEEEVRKITSVEQSHTTYIFVGYAIGMAVAVFIFLVEVLVNRLTRLSRPTRTM